MARCEDVDKDEAWVVDCEQVAAFLQAVSVGWNGFVVTVYDVDSLGTVVGCVVVLDSLVASREEWGGEDVRTRVPVGVEVVLVVGLEDLGILTIYARVFFRRFIV